MKKLLTILVIVSLMPLPARAAMVGIDAAIANHDRAAILSVLEREDVRAQLAARGVNPADVKARVAALTDEEAAELAARIDELPAGGILGLLLLIFLVLLLTDILGLTKVFTFTRPVR